MSHMSRVPIIALSLETKNLLATLLNPLKVLPTRSGSLRDWRGLAKICSIESEYLPALVSDADPFNKLLCIIHKKSPDFSVENLIKALKEIERWDIIDDSQSYLEKDAAAYLKRPQENAVVNDFVADEQVLTLDDQIRIQQGQELQHYDAFVLHADEDSAYVDEIIENLEEKNDMKLCMKNRDLIVGIRIEHKAIVDLIYHRCNRIIVVISPNLFKDPSNGYFINFAHAVGIEKRQERKILPCIYEHCPLPPELAYLAKLDFKSLKREYFWTRLIGSVKPVTNAAGRQKSSDPPIETRLPTSAVQSRVAGSSENRQLIQNLPSSESSSGILESPGTLEEAVSQSDAAITTDSESLHNHVTETILELPSIDGVDPLTTQTQRKSKTKPCKNSSKRNYLKKFQSLLKKC